MKAISSKIMINARVLTFMHSTCLLYKGMMVQWQSPTLVGGWLLEDYPTPGEGPLHSVFASK